MKKILVLFLLFISSSSLYAAGPYDGIYSVSISGFVSNYATVHEIDNKIVLVIIDPDPSNTWIAMSGSRTGNIVTLTNIPGVSASDININVTVNFNDSVASTATVNSCADGINYICKFPSDFTLDLNKIF